MGGDGGLLGRADGGDTSQRSLIAPAVERLLGLRSVERMMELARGNGELARRMSQLGATVLATDFSERMLELARARGRAGHGSDALGEGRELHPPHHWFGVGIEGQPDVQRYFHRPISLLFTTSFHHGLVLDGRSRSSSPTRSSRVRRLQCSRRCRVSWWSACASPSDRDGPRPPSVAWRSPRCPSRSRPRHMTRRHLPRRRARPRSRTRLLGPPRLRRRRP